MRTFIFGWNEQTWTYFLPAVEDLIASSGNILRCLLAIRTILPTPRVVVRPRRQDDQPNSDARTRGKLSTSACQCYRSRWSWVWETSFWQLSQLTNSQTVPVKDSLWGRRWWWKQHWKQRFPRRRRLLCGRESEAVQRLLPAQVDRRLRLNWIMNPPKERTRTNAQNIDAHQLSWRATWATDNILLLDHFFVTVRRYSSIVNLLSASHTWAFTSSLAAAKIHWI